MVDASAVTWRGTARLRATGGGWPAWGTEARSAEREKLCDYGRTVDALAPAAEEGRGHAAKCAGEGLAPGDPAISEWGNPAAVMGRHPANAGRAPGELKHLSTPRKREDSRSSGERNGRSPNHGSVLSWYALLSWGRTRQVERGTDRSVWQSLLAEQHWNG